MSRPVLNMIFNPDAGDHKGRPYGFSPIYSGMLLAGIGFVILVPHILTTCCAIVSYVGFEIQVRKVEEPYLRSVHGEAYVAYCRNVGRYLPRLRGAPHHNSRVSK